MVIAKGDHLTLVSSEILYTRKYCNKNGENKMLMLIRNEEETESKPLERYHYISFPLTRLKRLFSKSHLFCFNQVKRLFSKSHPCTITRERGRQITCYNVIQASISLPTRTGKYEISFQNRLKLQVTRQVI